MNEVASLATNQNLSFFELTQRRIVVSSTLLGSSLPPMSLSPRDVSLVNCQSQLCLSCPAFRFHFWLGTAPESFYVWLSRQHVGGRRTTFPEITRLRSLMTAFLHAVTKL